MDIEPSTLLQESPSNLMPLISSPDKISSIIEGIPADEATKKSLKLLFTKLTVILAGKYVKTDNMPIEIIENLYIGSIGSALSRDNLKNTGIRAILVCANLKEAFPDEFRYKGMNIKDSMDQDVITFFKETNEFIGKHLENKEKVLVHW